MKQEDIEAPQITSGQGYSLPHRIYLHAGTWLMRTLVHSMTGTGRCFDRQVVIDTPGVGGGKVSLSVCLPKDNKDLDDPRPLLLVAEGGGFVLGEPSDGEQNDRMLSDQLGAVVLSVDYAKSPYYPFPHALLQLHAVLKWALSPLMAEEMDVHIDPTRVAVMGNSAGGNLATALALLTSFTAGSCAQLREGLPAGFRLAAQVLLYPSTSCNILYRDRLDRAAAGNPRVREKSLPVWAAEMMEESYLPPYVMKDQIFVAPLSADLELLKSLQPILPPAVIMVAGLDCLGLEAVEYAENLRKAGVKVLLKEYPEAIHGFSHYKEGSKEYRKDDVDDCWEEVVKSLAERFACRGI